MRPRETYRIGYGEGILYLSNSDYEVDWETLKNTLVDEPYAADYHDATVLDIGAHKGYFGAYALAHGARAVVSYEPASENADLLERSASLAVHGGRWTVARAAVSSSAGEASLHLMGASWGHALHPPETFSQYETGVESVHVLPISDVLRDAATREGRLVVKINTEGEECETVLGTPAGAWSVVDEVLVEIHPWAACGAGDLAEHLAAAQLTPVASRHDRVLQLRRGAPRSG